MSESECPFCGSEAIERDETLSEWTCACCGRSWPDASLRTDDHLTISPPDRWMRPYGD